jgi:hypothetical protein
MSYFDNCLSKELYKHLLTEELLESWGFDIDQVKACGSKFSAKLTKRIYLHWNITDLDATIHQEVVAELSASGLGSRAPEDK